MKVYKCTSFKGVWHVGTSAVVVAESQERTARVLADQLEKLGLPQCVMPAQMVEIDTTTQHALILHDGDY